MSFSFFVPLVTRSEANRRDPWPVKARRAKAARNAARLSGYAYGSKHKLVFPLVVTLVRVSPRELDDDNLQGCLKNFRDGIADWLGVDDRKREIVAYEYRQERDGKNKGVRVEVRPRESMAAVG